MLLWFQIDFDFLTFFWHHFLFQLLQNGIELYRCFFDVRHVGFDLVWNTEAREAALRAINRAVLVSISINLLRSCTLILICHEVWQRQRPLVTAKVTILSPARMHHRIRSRSRALHITSILCHFHFFLRWWFIHQNLFPHVKFNQLHDIVDLHVAQLDALFGLD